MPRTNSQDLIGVEQSPIVNGKIKSRDILSEEYMKEMNKNKFVKSMDVFCKMNENDNDKNIEVEYDPAKLNALKRLSLLNNPTDYYKDDKNSKKKAVKFYLNNNSSNIKERMSGIVPKVNEENLNENEPDANKKPKESNINNLLFFI